MNVRYHHYVVMGMVGSLLAASPTVAEQQSDSIGDTFEQYATTENIARAVGTATGALIGSQLADGTTGVFTTAVGGLAGFLIGGHIGRELSKEDQEGLADATQAALQTGRNQDWQNANTGVNARIKVSDEIENVNSPLIGRIAELPALELINAYHVTRSNTNVRGGPGTEYAVLHRLPNNQHIPVIGQVIGSDWYMVAERGSGSGFIYAPLLSRSKQQSSLENAVRDAQINGAPVKRYAVTKIDCRVIDQEVRLPDGNTKSHSFRACQNSDGSWTEA